MANARRVRQDAEAAARRYAEYGKLVASYNANVDKMNSGNTAAVNLYNQQVQEFKDFQKAVEEGREYAVANIGSGNMWGGSDPIAEQRKSWPEGMVPAQLTAEEQKAEQESLMAQAQYVNQKTSKDNLAWLQSFGPDGPPFGAQPPAYDFNADPNYPKSTVEQRWVSEDSAEGKKTLLALSNAGQFAVVKGKDGKIIAADTDERGFSKDAGFMVNSVAELGATPRQMGPLTAGEKQKWVRNGDGTATRYVASDGQWVPTGGSIKILAWDKEEPVQQTDVGAAPEQPKDWNPSLREKAELENPTANAAGANMAAAMGSYAKTGLMNEASRNSQSLTNSDTGVLNRVMQGIL
jgi:hypothetical protein